MLLSICGLTLSRLYSLDMTPGCSPKGINRLKILQDAIDCNLHPGQAAEMLGITATPLQTAAERYRQLGPLGMTT